MLPFLWVSPSNYTSSTSHYFYVASIYAGFMLGNLPKDKAGLISKEHICEGGSQCHVME